MGRSGAVLLCADDALFCDRLTGLLATLGSCWNVITTDPAGALRQALEQQPALLICNHEPPAMDGIGLVSALRSKMEVPVLLAARSWSAELVKAAVAAGTAAFLTSDPTQAELSMALFEAQARMEYEEQQGRKLRDVEQRLADRKLIEKAKGILMEQQKISEDAAFRLMRSRAMSSRVSMAQLAEELLTKSGQPGWP